MNDRFEEDRCSVYCGNLSSKVTEDVLYELFLQAGPVARVTIPKDPTGCNRGFAFVLFSHPTSVNYAEELLNDISLFGRKIHVRRRNNFQDEPPPQMAQQDFALNVSALTPMNQPFNTGALTPVDHSFMPFPPTMPFGNSMFNLAPLGVSAYPSQMNNFGGPQQNQGFNPNFNQNPGQCDSNFDRGRDWNNDRFDRNDRGDRDFKRHDRNYNRRGNDRFEERGYSRNDDRGYNRNEDRGYSRNEDRGFNRNEDRNFNQNRSHSDRDYNDRSKHSRDSSRGFNRGNSSNDRSSSHSRRDFPSSDNSSHGKRRRY
nr:PREDICTED: RNA-binding protein 7 [Bemisia tabaci]